LALDLLSHRTEKHTRLPVVVFKEKATEYSDVLSLLQLFTREQQRSMDAQTQQLSRLQLTVAQAFPGTPAD